MELVILSGMQASGKLTFCRQRFAGHVLVSKDLRCAPQGHDGRALEEACLYGADAEDPGFARQEVATMITALLSGPRAPSPPPPT